MRSRKDGNQRSTASVGKAGLSEPPGVSDVNYPLRNQGRCHGSPLHVSALSGDHGIASTILGLGDLPGDDPVVVFVWQWLQ